MRIHERTFPKSETSYPSSAPGIARQVSSQPSPVIFASRSRMDAGDTEGDGTEEEVMGDPELMALRVVGRSEKELRGQPAISILSRRRAPRSRAIARGAAFRPS